MLSLAMITIHCQSISLVQRHLLTFRYYHLGQTIDNLLMECGVMPKKIRELKQLLRKAGFVELPGKGSHTNWIHPLYPGKITVSGKDSADAKPYQEKEILRAIQNVEKNHDHE